MAPKSENAMNAIPFPVFGRPTPRSARCLLVSSLAFIALTAPAQQPLNTLPMFEAESHRIFEIDAASPANQCGTRCGKTMAMDGDLLVLGASYFIRSNQLPGPTGARYPIVLEYQNNEWVKVANLATWVPNVFTTTGWPSAATSVAVEGDVIALGDPNENGTNRGAVRVFVKPEGGWPGPVDVNRLRPTAILTAPSGLGRLGTSVAILNGAIVAGAPDAELFGIGTIPDHGAVYIWEEPPGGWGAVEPVGGQPVERRPDHAVAPSDMGVNRMGTRIAVAEIDGKEEIVVTNEDADELFLLRRNGLTWQFERLFADLGAPAPFDTVNALIYDGNTLLVGYDERPFAQVAERISSDPTVPWNVARLSRGSCVSDGCAPLESAMGRALALLPDGVLLTDPLMFSDGFRLSGGLLLYPTPTGPWSDTTVPWSEHFTPVYPPSFPISRSGSQWGDQAAYDNGRLAINIPVSPGIGFDEPTELFRTGISFYESAARRGPSGRAEPQRGANPAAEPAKKLYLSKDQFCQDTLATHATGTDLGVCSQGDAARMPADAQQGYDITVGQLRFTSQVPHQLFTGQDWTPSLLGPDIGVSSSEEFDVETVPLGTELYAIGFTIHEDFEGNTGEPGIRDDSLFTVRLLNGATQVHQFDFNPMDDRSDFLQDTAVFIGVWSDEPFDRITIRETRYFDTFGNSANDSPLISEEGQNEFFGPFFTGTVPRSVELELSPPTLDFGNQLVGSNGAILSSELSSTGDGTVTIDSIGAVPPPFFRQGGTCGTAPFDLAPGERCTVNYRFAPGVAGPASTNLPIDSNSSGASDTLALSGNGIDPQLITTPERLVFNDQPIGLPSSPLKVFVNSVGSSDLVLGTLSVVGLHASEFELRPAANNCSSAVLPSGSFCSFEIVFTPAAPGVRSARVSMQTNTINGEAVIELRGTNGVVFFDGFE